jgi:1,4-dihydroxy-2-naphthoyl-CoA hydrolase
MSTIDQLNARSQGYLPGLIGVEFTGIEPGRLTSLLAIRPELIACNRYTYARPEALHAALPCFDVRNGSSILKHETCRAVETS